jgi:hypothetical protein
MGFVKFKLVVPRLPLSTVTLNIFIKKTRNPPLNKGGIDKENTEVVLEII